MTFEEWYESLYGVHPNDIKINSDAYYQLQISRIAWNGSRENLRTWDI
jgi:hypothetical protein